MPPAQTQDLTQQSAEGEQASVQPRTMVLSRSFTQSTPDGGQHTTRFSTASVVRGTHLKNTVRHHYALAGTLF